MQWYSGTSKGRRGEREEREERERREERGERNEKKESGEGMVERDCYRTGRVVVLILLPAVVQWCQ